MKAIKNILKIGLIILVFAVGVSIIGCDTPPEVTTTAHPCAAGHTEVIDPGVKATCTEDGITDGKHCSVCNEVLIAQEVAPALGHKISVDAEIPASCTTYGRTKGSHCSRCHLVIEKTVQTEPLGHDVKKYDCSRCSYSKFSDPTSYSSSYGYEYLGTLENGEAMQKFYTRLDELALNFHTNSSLTLLEPSPFTEGNYLLDPVKYGDLGLAYDEAETVMSSWDNDRPIYYWLSSDWSLNRNSGSIWLETNRDYIAGKDRAKYNSLIYSAIEEYVISFEREESEYMLTLGYHNKIIESIDYAYESDGVTAMSTTWAHSILGVFDGRGAVCEGYAKALQLLLTFSGVENYYVRGIANGGGHAWNLIKLDDGEWYWCDPTWDDDKYADYGIKYSYFCVTDTESFSIFTKTHTQYTPSSSAPYNRIYPLPDRSSKPFDEPGVNEIYDIFEVNGYRYEVSGYRTVRSLGTSAGMAGSPPSRVTYNGIEYTVKK